MKPFFTIKRIRLIIPRFVDLLFGSIEKLNLLRFNGITDAEVSRGNFIKFSEDDVSTLFFLLLNPILRRDEIMAGLGINSSL